MTHAVQVNWVSSAGVRRTASEDYPLPVTATFSGSISVGNVEGDAAHDAADTGDPVKVGFKAESATPAAVADNDRSNWSGTLYGAGFVNLRRAADGAEVGTLSAPLTVQTLDQGGNQAVNISGQVDDVAPATAAEGATSPLRMTPTRDLHVNLRDQSGAEIGTTSNPLFSFIQGGVYQQGVATGGDRYPLLVGSVAKDAEPTAVDNNDAVQAYFDLNGYQHVKAHGDIAHDAVDSGAPVKIGGRARTSFPTGVANDDRVDAYFDQYGRLVVSQTNEGGVAGTCGISGVVDEVAPLVSAEGGTNTLRMTPTRDLRVCLTDSAGADMGTGSNQLYVRSLGFYGHDEPSSGGNGYPLVVGGVGLDTQPSSVSAQGDVVQAYFDRNGYQHVAQAHASRSDTFTGTTNGTTVDVSQRPCSMFSLQVTETGGVTVWSVVVEGSNDGTTFSTLITHAQTDGSGKTLFTSDKPCLYFRSRCATITGGTNLVAVITGLQ